jgi:outer membrane protein OmpA-like peptidoglycan-associated protein
MNKMKKIIFASLFMLVSVFSFAQEEVAKPELRPTKDYLVGSFADNWFISAGVGFQTYLSEYYTAGSIIDHFSPALNVGVGKWFTPVMGVRAQFSGINARGYNLLSTPYIDANEMEDGAYKMNFYYMNLHADFLFNIHSQFYRYNPERKYELIPFVGMGWFSTLKDGIADNEFAANIGIINQFRINDRLDVDVELKAAVLRSAIDGNPAKRINVPASATIGLSYKIGKEKEFKEGITPETLAEVQNKAAQKESELQNQNDALKADQQRKNDELNKALEQERQKNAQLQKENNDLKNRPQQTTSTGSTTKGIKVFYEIGKTELDDFNSANLEYIAEYIKSTNRKYTITGYADSSTGGKSINEKLANKRAVNVYNLLVDNYGVNKDLLSIESSVVDPQGLAPEMVRMAEVK